MARRETFRQADPVTETLSLKTARRIALAAQGFGRTPPASPDRKHFRDVARRLGVKTETIAAWEGDRSEPRAHRLIMLAGILGVAPTWLLSGFGSAPASQPVDAALGVITLLLEKLKEQHQHTAATIDALQREIATLGRHLQNDA